VKSKREGKKLLSLREYSYFEIETKQPKNHLEAGLFYFQQSIFSILLNTLTISFMSKFITLAFLSALLFNGCTIEKRTYSNGYHTTWNVHHILPNKTVAKKFQNGHYLQPEITKEQSAKTIDSIDKQPKALELKPELTPIEIKKEEKKNSLRQSNVVSDTLPDKLYSKEEENFLENVRKLKVARAGCISSFITFVSSIALYAATFSSFAAICLAIGIIGVLVFGTLGKIYLARKNLAFEALVRSTNNSKDYQTKSNALNKLLLVELETIIKGTKAVTLISGIAVLIALMIDSLEVGALGFIVFPIPLIVFCISLLVLLGLIIKKGILTRKIKN
jgi:hypothetical protein